MCAPLPTLEECMAKLNLVLNHITIQNFPKQDPFLVHLCASFEQVSTIACTIGLAILSPHLFQKAKWANPSSGGITIENVKEFHKEPLVAKSFFPTFSFKCFHIDKLFFSHVYLLHALIYGLKFILE